MGWPWTIWRHVLVETLRVVLLAAGVLAVLMAFAATVRFTAEGRLSPGDTLRFLALAIVPMLQYVLPFAAGFGATLAYHRLAQDNELLAASAAGIGHVALLAPAAAVGLLAAGILWHLNHEVIPHLLRSMERLVARDAARLVARTIESGGALTLGRHMIYADRVYRVPARPETRGANGPHDVLVLTGVAAMELDDDGRVTGDATAAQAFVAFYPVASARSRADTDVTLVSLDLRQARATGRLEALQAERQAWVFPLRGAFNDDPKFCTRRELAELPEHPDRLNIIDAPRRELALCLAERQALRAIAADLLAQGQTRLTDAQQRTFLLRARALQERGDLAELLPSHAESGIELDIFAPDAQGRPDPARRVRVVASRATLRPDAARNPLARTIALTLELTQAQAYTREGESGGVRATLRYHALSPPDDPLTTLGTMQSAELLRLAEACRDDPAVAARADELRSRIQRLRREIVSKQHERLAMSVAAFVMVLAGAVTAMRLRHALPLTVYLWSFFPALGTVISISAGQQMTHRLGPSGLVLLWGGVVALGGYVAGAFRLVRQH